MDVKLSRESYSKSILPSKPRPGPVDFDMFFPIACIDLGVINHVIIQKVLMADYVSSHAPKEKTKKKNSKRRDTISIVPTDRRGSRVPSIIPSLIHERVFQYVEDDDICVEAVYDTSQRLIKLKFTNNKEIPREVMKILGLIVPYHPYLESISVNSGINMQGIYEISKFLPISKITEVILDNTYFTEANYHILLDNNCLKHLSLARCQLNDTVLEILANKLDHPNVASKSLIALNLSSNFITDVGVKYLARMLRANRTLAYINLASNMITDKGAISILNTLDEFVLTEQEAKSRKLRYMKYVTRKMEVARNTFKELKEREEMKERIMKRKSVRQSMAPTSLAPTKSKNKSDKEHKYGDELLREQAAAIADTIFGPFVDPFGSENIEFRDKQTICYGNNTLCYLNLAYNNLSYVSLKKLLQVLIKQNELKRKPRGLTNVVIEGNKLPVTCEEYYLIETLLVDSLFINDTKVIDKTKRKSIHKTSQPLLSQPPTTPTN